MLTKKLIFYVILFQIPLLSNPLEGRNKARWLTTKEKEEIKLNKAKEILSISSYEKKIHNSKFKRFISKHKRTINKCIFLSFTTTYMYYKYSNY